MDRGSALLAQYHTQLSLPWRRDIAGAERVWIAVYPPDLERLIRPKLPEFELATKSAGHTWHQVDLTKSFAAWLAGQEYREAYFQEPEAIAPALENFAQAVEQTVRTALTADGVDENGIVAVFGVASLFPMARVSTLIQRAAQDVRGRLLVFFPGALEHGNYRLLDARDGWNYLAIPITIPEGANP
jgi:hypothetical protein